jgi:tRNA nucleotidyltransferase (CCA-adding enzyme)
LSRILQDAFIKKISRERVGKELLGMLTGTSAHPERALKMLHDLGLCKSVFLPPLPQPIYKPDGTVVDDQSHFDEALWEQGYAYASAMYDLMVERSGKEVLDVGSMNDDEQNALKLRILSAFLMPFAEHYLLIKKRQQRLPVYIIRESLKVRWDIIIQDRWPTHC